MDPIIRAVSDGFGEEVLLMLRAFRGGFRRERVQELEKELGWTNQQLMLGQPANYSLQAIWSLVLHGNLDLNEGNVDGHTILHHAVLHCEPEIVAAFVTELKLDVNAKTRKDLFTPLHLAVRGTAGRLGCLTHHYINTLDPENDSISSESSKMVETLVKCNAAVDAKDQNSRTPLHEAAASGDTGSVEILLGEDVSQHILQMMVSARDRSGVTPLHEAARSGNAGCIVALLAKGADAQDRDNNGDTPLHKAALSGNEECVVALLRRRGSASDLYARDRIKGNITALQRHAAALTGSCGCQHTRKEQKQNLKMRGRVDVKNSLGESPLHVAVTRGNSKAVKVLMALGADGKAELNPAGTPRTAVPVTPLSMALEGRFDEVGSILLSFCIPPYTEDELTTIVDARLKSLEEARKLARNYLPKSAWRLGLIHKAAMLDSTCVLAYLLQIKKATSSSTATAAADELVAIRDDAGVVKDQRTPLHIAAICQNLPAIRLLLQQYQDLVDPMQEDVHGWTALDYAVEPPIDWKRRPPSRIRHLIPRFLRDPLGRNLFEPRESRHEQKNTTALKHYKMWEMKELFMEDDRLKKNVEVLEKEEQKLMQAVNGFTVVAVLMAGASFAGWLQPPLAFDGSSAWVGKSMCVRVFWVANCLCFLCAFNSVMIGATMMQGARLPVYSRSSVHHMQLSVTLAFVWFIYSAFSGLLAFSAAGFASLPTDLKYEWLMIGPLLFYGLYTILMPTLPTEVLSNVLAHRATNTRSFRRFPILRKWV